ncbi:MAG: hypothetical protein GEU80_00950 [Dehalococcoidia bacterium]|nr:hypothetical protein [Dehalococcoidia bacterium]
MQTSAGRCRIPPWTAARQPTHPKSPSASARWHAWSPPATNERIAETLGISLAGAKYHVSELLGRLGVSRREEIGEWYRGEAGRLRTLRRRPVIVSWLGWLTAGGAAAAAVAGIVLLMAVLNEDSGAATSAPPSDTPTATPNEEPTVAAAVPGTFAAVAGGPASERGHTVTVLDDGRVLIAGGSQYIQPRTDILQSTQFFDPSTGVFASGPRLGVPRWRHTATLLQDGRVLVAGGGNAPLASAEIIDPSTGALSPTGDLIEARTGHAAIRLSDGRVLVAGGFRESRNPEFSLEALASAEIYDPETGLFEPAGESPALQTTPALVLLQDGRVLVVGDGPLTMFEPASSDFRTLNV